MKKHRGLKIAGIVLLSLILIIGIALGIYAYSNLHYSENAMKKVWKAGFEEKTATLSDGTVLNYGEGPNNGPALLLIYGQSMSWEDYASVLPELSETWHVYAIDCHGHGESTHNENDYTCTKMGNDFIEFIENVIGEKCVVSGHSSGGILSGYIAATAPEDVYGAVLEDPPFFGVQPNEMQNNFVFKDGFEICAEFLQQSEETEFVPYYYAHSYMWKQFGDLSTKMSADAKAQLEKNPDKTVRFWYLPYKWTFGTDYMRSFDQKFGMAFYNDTWLEPGQQIKILKGIKCPTVYLKAATAYGPDGVLYAANSDADSDRVTELINNCERVVIKSGHDIHTDKPKEFIKGFSEINNLANFD